MLWFEITAITPPGDVDGVDALLRDVAPGGVTIEEPVDILGPEKGFRVRASEPVLIRAYLPASELGAVLTDQLRTTMHETYPHVELSAKPLYEQDWSVSWREFFGVVDFGGRILVVPSWIEHEARPDQIVVRLDPGQAFGTGHHETTRLCLAALEEFVRPGDRILDVGTGSGILSIGAILLGAGHATGMDIDPLAAQIALANCQENGVADRVTIGPGTLDPAAHAQPYDIVVANISTDANSGLIPAFAQVVRPEGWLLLSGILAEDGQRVAAVAAEHGFAFIGSREERDWCQLTFRRG
jgi:ribosomal protein L11 methyltransferase